EMGVDLYRENAGAIQGVILDMSMPKMSGLDAFLELKKINSGVKVLLASGFRDDPRVKECMEKGAADFIQKPYTMSELAAKTYLLLNRKPGAGQSHK
ncbi:MAG: response regulator, partial [Spirochaetota bacterium]